MPHPARHVGLEGVHAKPVPQSFRHGGRANDSGSGHEFLYAPPSGRAAPTPDPPKGKIWIALASTYLEDVIEFGEDTARQGYLPDDATLAALQGRDVRDAAIDVDRCGCERQDFGNAATGQTQNETKELHVQGRRCAALMKRRRSAALRYFRLPVDP